MVVWWCTDWGCRSPIETETGHEAIALNADGDGLPLVAYAERAERGFEVFIGFCDDPACSTHHRAAVYASDQEGWGNPNSLVTLPDESPVLFFRPASGFEQGLWTVVVCDDPQCSEATVHHQENGWTEIPSGDPNLPWIVYTTGTEVRLLSCTNESCTIISDQHLFTIADAQIQLDAKAARVGDDLWVLVRHASDFDDDDFADYHVDLFRCAAQSCTQVEDVPFSKGNYFDIAATEGGGLAIAIQSGRPWLCIEECADPTDQLSRLTLHFTEPTD